MWGRERVWWRCVECGTSVEYNTIDALRRIQAAHEQIHAAHARRAAEALEKEREDSEWDLTTADRMFLVELRVAWW